MSIRELTLVVAVSAVLVPAGANAQLQIVDNLSGKFEDISATGTLLDLLGDQSTTITSTVSNAVFPAGNVVVSNNGGIAFGNPPSLVLASVNEPIPSSQAFGGGQALLPYWDDIGNIVGEIYYSQNESSLIIQWNQKRFEGSTDTATFEIKVFDGVPDPPGGGSYAQFIYVDIEQPSASGGASATIGYQDGSRAYNDVQWSFNTAGAVSNGTVLSLIPEPSTLTSAGWLLLLIRIRQRAIRCLR